MKKKRLLIISITSLVSLIMPAIFIPISCATKNQEQYSFQENYASWKNAIEKTAKDGAVNIFLTRNTALDYILSSIISLIQDEIRIKDNIECMPNKNSNIIFIEEKIWDYTTKETPSTSTTYPYKFQSLLENVNDLWDSNKKWNSGLGYLGIFTNSNDVPNRNPEIEDPFLQYQLNINQVIAVDDYLNSFNAPDDKKVEYNLFVDDLMLQNLYNKKEEGLFGLLNRVKHIYIFPEGQVQASQTNGITAIYSRWINSSNNYDPNFSHQDQIDLYNEKFKPKYWDLKSQEFQNNYKSFSEPNKEYNLFNFFANRDLINMFFYDGDYYKSIQYNHEETRMYVDNALVDYSSYPLLFNISNTKNLFHSFEGIFDIDSNQKYDFTSFIEDGANDYDPNKTNLIFILDKVWSIENISQPTANNSEADIKLVTREMQKMMKQFSIDFPVEKYNYILKPHPRITQLDHISTTTLFCEGTNIKPILLKKELPFEVILGKDLKENNATGDYNLINPNDFLETKPFCEMTGFFVGYQITSTIFFTTLATINAVNNKNCTEIMLDNLIPTKYNFVVDHFKVNGTLNNICTDQPLNKNRTFIIVTNNYFWKIGHYKEINEFNVLSNYIKNIN